MTARTQIEIGKQFGFVQVIAHAAPKNQKSCVEVQCVCGKSVVVRTNSLLTGNTKSCGCIRPGARTHGHTTGLTGVTRTYSIWCNMRARCAGQISYENYAGRGIAVCDRWLSYENFLSDMGEAPEGLSLDRIDNDGNYEPANCRWATTAEQCRNRRTNVFIEHEGKRMCLRDWETFYGMPMTTTRRYFSRIREQQKKGNSL